MSEHEQYAEDLALYALNALEGDERAKLEEHLATCAACRLELERLRSDMALLAISAAGPRPPQRARQRLLDAIAREARPQPAATSAPSRRRWWGWLGWAAAAAVLLFTLSLRRDISMLKERLVLARSRQAETTRQLDELRKIALPIIAPEAQRVTLVATKTTPQPQGKAFYLRDRASLVFVASNMPALPPRKAYELWLIPVSGNPIPAGMFRPDSHGSASVVNPPLPPGTAAKAFAITVESEAGSAAPTTPILMMGAGE
jgi:anti-sigma-K factor RskA